MQWFSSSVTERAAITTADCVQAITPATEMAVGYKTASRALYAIQSSSTYPGYNSANKNSNLGVVITVRNIVFDLNVGPACMFVNQNLPKLPAATVLEQVRTSDFYHEHTTLVLTAPDCITLRWTCTNSAGTKGCGVSNDHYSMLANVLLNTRFDFSTFKAVESPLPIRQE